LHFFELYRLDLDSHSHALSEEIPDIGRGPEIETAVAEAYRANVKTAESRSAGRIGDSAFLSASHYGDFIPIIKAGNRGDHVTVKAVRRGPGMYRWRSPNGSSSWKDAARPASSMSNRIVTSLGSSA
jgi:hypothetical protein